MLERVIRELFQLVGHPDGNGRKHDFWWRFLTFLKIWQKILQSGIFLQTFIIFRIVSSYFHWNLSIGSRDTVRDRSVIGGQKMMNFWKLIFLKIQQYILEFGIFTQYFIIFCIVLSCFHWNWQAEFRETVRNRSVIGGWKMMKFWKIWIWLNLV